MVSKFTDQAGMIIPFKRMLYLVSEQIELTQHHDCHQGEGKKAGEGDSLLCHISLDQTLTG